MCMLFVNQTDAGFQRRCVTMYVCFGQTEWVMFKAGIQMSICETKRDDNLQMDKRWKSSTPNRLSFGNPIIFIRLPCNICDKHRIEHNECMRECGYPTARHEFLDISSSVTASNMLRKNRAKASMCQPSCFKLHTHRTAPYCMRWLCRKFTQFQNMLGVHLQFWHGFKWNLHWLVSVSGSIKPTQWQKSTPTKPIYTKCNISAHFSDHFYGVRLL